MTMVDRFSKFSNPTAFHLHSAAPSARIYVINMEKATAKTKQKGSL